MMTLEEQRQALDDLNAAKHNVRWLLDHPKGSVDNHGIAYWASVLERLRRQLQEQL